MSKIPALIRRFADLSDQLEIVASTKFYKSDTSFQGNYVDSQQLLNWVVKCRNPISMSCGAESEHYRRFIIVEKDSYWAGNYDKLINLKAVFEAAREDYEGGFLTSVRSLIQADVFSDELEQASELMKSGYHTAAAVVAGVVLETTLRQMCNDSGIPIGKLDKMNADLAKAGVYNSLVQKRITALAGVRNSAAHGHPEEFTQQDVSEMIAYVEGFVGDHL